MLYKLWRIFPRWSHALRGRVSRNIRGGPGELIRGGHALRGRVSRNLP